jgi:hypothetical protein
MDENAARHQILVVAERIAVEVTLLLLGLVVECAGLAMDDAKIFHVCLPG